MNHPLVYGAVGAMFALTSAMAAAQNTPGAAPRRTEVKAEPARARPAVAIQRGEVAPKNPNFTPGKTRKQRKAETRGAIARDEVTVEANANSHATTPLSKTSQVSRAEVKQEARTATKADRSRGGEIGPGQMR